MRVTSICLLLPSNPRIKTKNRETERKRKKEGKREEKEEGGKRKKRRAIQMLEMKMDELVKKR
jgi:hypothetical protein